MSPRAGTLLLFAGVVALHTVALPNGFVYDDHEVVLQQAPVRSVGDVARIFVEPHGLPQSQLPYYRPIPRATLLIQKGLHGDRAVWFHAANAVLMGGVALAGLALLRSPGLGLGRAAAWWAAAAFAIHPIASETSFPIASGRETAIPTLFVVLALAAWLRDHRGLALLAGAAALWSKEQAIVLPVLVALADGLGLGTAPPQRRVRDWAVRLLPWLALTVLYLVVRNAVLPPPPAGDSPERLLAWVAEHPFAPPQSLLYLVQSALAPSAALLYEPRLAVWFSPWRAGAAAVAFGAVLAWAGSRGPRAAVWFWLGWLPLGMVFHLGWLPIETQFSERYLLLSSLGVAALVALAAGRSADSVLARRRLVPIGGALALLMLSGLSLHRAGYYGDEFAFTRQWVASDPLHGNAHASLGAALARDGLDVEAIPALREAVRLEPRLASAWYNLGVVLTREGRRHEAIDALTSAVRADAGDPDIRYALGVLQGERGDLAAAELHLRAALALRPDFPEAAAALERFTAPSPPR